MGFSTEYYYNYRNYFEYSFDISVLQEIRDIDLSNVYYTLGINFFINDGLIKGISEFRLYFNQYFSSEILNTSSHKGNMIFGANLRTKLLKNL